MSRLRVSLRRARPRDRLAGSLAVIVLVFAALGQTAPLAAQDATPPVPRVLTADSLRVVFWAGDEGIARRVFAIARDPGPLPGLPSEYARLRGTIFLAPDPTRFDSLAGGGAPGWAAGVAIPSLRRIVVPAFRSARTPAGDPVAALRHEVAHLALNDYLPGQIPRWFDEGYATWASGGWDESSGWQIRLALARGHAPVLDSLTLSWPRWEARARLAYLLSASAVRFLASRGSGEPAFAAFLRTWRREGDVDAAMRVTYQITLGQFEKEWRAMVKRRYGWLLALSQSVVFWAVLALLFVIVGTARRRYDRRRLEAMRAEDTILLPGGPQGPDAPESPGPTGLTAGEGRPDVAAWREHGLDDRPPRA